MSLLHPTPTTLATTTNTDHNQILTRLAAYKTALLLRAILIPDLVRPILEHAQLYNHQTSVSDQYQVISADNTPAACLQSEQISCLARTKFPVRRVTFTIVAKEQGFGAWPGQGQWTWFSAGVLKRGGQEDEEEEGEGGVIGDERVVARNCSSADGGFGTLVVVWSADSEDGEEARWVRGLGVGDRVVVRGYAERSGWRSFVRFVRVEIETIVVVR